MHAPRDARPLAPTQPLFAVGQKFGAYVVEAVAGEGGMGAVYKARDTKLGRLVALKVIRPNWDEGSSSRTDADTIARFLREAKVGAALSHPGVAVVYEAGAIGDNPYLAMEWVDGSTLTKLVRERTLPVARLLEILEGVGDALAYAHGQGVIHRDVKPSNVMVDARGRVRLVDFGIAKPTKLLGAPGTQMLPTHARAVLGTPAYMAPEQMLSPSVDARADQFSWAVMAYEILGNAHPIETVPDGGPAFPVARPKPLQWLRPDLSEAVAAIVHRAMSYEAGGRFPTMDELLVALRTAKASATAPAPGLSYPPAGALTTAPSSAPTVGPTWNTHSASATPPPRMASFGPPAPVPAPVPAPAKRFPIVAVLLLVFGIVVFLGGSVVAILLITSSSGSGSAASSGGSPISLPLGGPKTAFLESFDDLKFAAPPAEIARAKAALEQRIGTCFDGNVSKGLEFRAEVDVAADGRIVKIVEQNVCKEDRPSWFLCTERGKVPKKGFPSMPDPVFACIDRTLLATRLPKVTNVDSDTKVQNADLTFQVR